METADNRIMSQLRRNAVALISLVVAVSSLGYNTWRNEQTEFNRNQRQAAFEILLKLGELQQVVFHSHYDQDEERGSPRTGWAYVLTVRDLSTVVGAPLDTLTDELVAVWSSNWQRLGSEQTGADAIIAAIDRAREQTMQVLRSLD